MSFDVVKAFNLLAANLGIVDLENIDGIFVVKTVFVDTYDCLTARVDTCLRACRCFLDAQLRQTCFDSLCHTAEFLDFLDVLPCAVCDFVGKGFYIVAAAPRVDGACNLCFLLDINLGVTGNTCREIGRKRDGFVECVGMEALGMAESGAHSFDTGTTYIVERILFGERPARRLRVCAKRKRFGVLGVELLYNLCPQHTCRAHFGNFHEVVHADCPEERQTGCESVDIHACVNTCTKIFKTVGKSVSQFDVAGCAGFLHVVAGDRNRVELWHILRGVLEDVGDNTHRELRRINIGVAHHEFLKDIVLDGTGHFVKLCTLFQACIDVESKYGKNGSVHGHGNGHLVQRNTVEKNFHVV